MSIELNAVPTDFSAEEWFALRVRARSERLSAAELTGRGFGVYAPLVTEQRRYSDRIKTATTAMFPGYVFCRFNLREQGSVLGSPGVQHIVSVAGVPAPISEEDLTRLKRVIECGAQPAPYMSVGDRIRISQGPLCGVEGILLRNDGDDRLLVSIEMLQRAVAVRVKLDQIEPVRISSGTKAVGVARQRAAQTVS